MEMFSAKMHDMRAVPRETDYYDMDGILRCGRCDQPRECVVDRWAIARMPHDEPRYLTLPCVCACQSSEARHDAGMAGRVRQLRAECYDIPGLSECSLSEDDGRCPEAVSTVREYLAEFGPGSAGLYLYGSGGTGKTWAAASLANELLSRGKRCAFSSLPLLVRAGSYERVIARLSMCEMVVLDDLGAERGTDTMREGARVIVDAVYAKGTPLVVTSNLTPGQLGEMDERIGRRVSERCLPIEFA